MRQQSSITSKGQITIPAKMRKAMGLKPGGKVLFVMKGGKIEIEPVKEDVTEVFGLLRASGRGRSASPEEISEEGAEERYVETVSPRE